MNVRVMPVICCDLSLEFCLCSLHLACLASAKTLYCRPSTARVTLDVTTSLVGAES